MTLEHYFLLFLIYSFLGWLIEVVNALIIEEKFINRGFLIGPYCPIYGVGALFITFLLDKYVNDVVVLFVMAVIICCALEYFTSYLMEKLFGTRWWDYSDKKFNINGRICLETAVLFGVLGLLIMYVLNPFFTNILISIPHFIIQVLFFVLLLLFVLDFAVSFKIIAGIDKIKLDTVKDSTEEVTNLVKNTLLNASVLNRRLAKAFPNFKISNEKLRKKIEEYKEKRNKRE